PRLLASDVSREKVSSRARRRHRSAPPDKHDAPPCLCRGRLPLRRASAQNRPGLYLAIAQTRANTSTRPRNLLHIGDFSSCFPVGRGLVDTWPVHSKTNMNYRTFFFEQNYRTF